MSDKKPRLVACPNCQKYTAFSPENTFRPFCSERCKMIDLGSWANEQYTIATPVDPSTFDDEQVG
jgi:endogenous inhibitor of DNA gyrase (YacG/DUF329 family)